MSIASGADAPMEPHELLLRMAGRISDASLAQARRMLADGAASSAGALLASVLASAPVPLTAAELTAARLLTRDRSVLADAEAVAELPALPFVFSQFGSGGAAEVDDLDHAVVAAAEPHGEAVSEIWRSWRYMDLELLLAETDDSDPDDGSWGALTPLTRAIDAMPDPLYPYRVYLVKAQDQALAQGLAADLLRAVPDTANAGLEILMPGAELPPYQRAAMSDALLLWGPGGPEFTVARVFDFADPRTGPGFEPGHPVIDDPAERGALLEYLHGGFPVLTSLALMDDILNAEAGPAVPTSFRTDGVWIWQDPVAYYLEEHHISPDAALTAHIRQQLSGGIAVPQTDEDTANRAAEFILQPPADSEHAAVWFPGGP